MKAIAWPCSGVICIMASGIVVRAAAPLLRHKSEDPALLVLDSAGRYVISLLSGTKTTPSSTDPSAHGSGVVEYGTDGRVANTHRGVKLGGVVEAGTEPWRVSEKVRLCISWQRKSEEECRYLVPLGGGAYDLAENPSRSG